MHARCVSLLLLLSLILLVGCASIGQSLVVSGESLKAVGNEFIAVADVYVRGCAAQTISLSQCVAFRDFGEKFKVAYPMAIQLWGVARNANDVATAKKAEDVIKSLMTDLSVFASQVLTGGK